MKTFVSLSLSVLAVGGLLVSCGAPAVTPSTAAESPADISQVKMPVLRSAYFEKNWGKPEVTVAGDGSYRLKYRQGTTLNFVFINGLVKAEPTPAIPPMWGEESWDEKRGVPTMIEHPQSWRTTTILGKPVKWYQNDSGGGADFPLYKTVDFTATAPDGRVGYYRVEVCCTSDAQAAEWIKRVGW